MENSSRLLSLVSTLCWIVALLPQQWHNYCRKSVDGLSPYLLILWLLGDSFNLVGCVLTEQLPFQTYLSAYFVLNDVILDFQYYYYRGRRPDAGSSVELLADDGYTSTVSSSSVASHVPVLTKTQVVTTATALLSASPVAAVPLQASALSAAFDGEAVGMVFAWLCTLLYCSSRLPQLYHNYLRKSVEGVSPLLFTFAVLANLTYALSILLADPPHGMTYRGFIWNETPYLLGSLGTVWFDGLYFWQREIYREI
ncbi:hypothetical protein PICMEDRAFT_69987 [Pichia membranifaciens NRRL Y-2026]|uniref:Uncharacterized protein n=1 Tax=Pichia membranifaciens NRRL Y-2026 TaxID=763406 RepID=A0A1E3NQH8_9ASCO|nr:hypothetical protein PICMEDRAFT_69987 [Pichia membranifaciens NRRL Y-2026]ODQ48341.1 hypothetical protein PICMEDRAFT_69987 [Pichia membranifaciens NRRL Y-2026]